MLKPKKGGGVQVADSVCCQLYRFPRHRFIVVLSSYMDNTKDRLKEIEEIDNVKVVSYDIKNSLSTLIFGRDKKLDNLVESNSVDAVFTVFGPSRWRPRVPHLSGFALPQMVIPDSPNGILLRDNSIETVFNATRNAIINYDEHIKMANAARPFIEENFNSEVEIKNLIGFYNLVKSY